MIRLLRRLLPKRIGSQMALLIAASLLIANVFTAVTLSLFGLPPRFAELPFVAMTRLAVVAKLIDAAPTPEARAAILAAARSSLPGLTQMHQAFPSERSPLHDPMFKDLQSELGDRFAVLPPLVPPDPHLSVQVSIALQDGNVLTTPLPPFRRRLGPTLYLLGTLLFVGVSVLLLSVWAARALSAPLRRLADAAERFSVGGSDAPLAEQGPMEVKRAAEALNEMRGRVRRLVEDRTRMLAAISHDLRTPITRLRLRAEEIGQEPLKKQMIRDLETMQAMVQSALAFLRDQTAPCHKTVNDLPTLLQTLCDDFSDLGHAVSYAGPAHLYVECDQERLTRAVNNLIDNALKFGTKAELRVQTLPTGGVAIDVQDDGPGIADAEKPRVLEPFYRGDAARSLNEKDSFGLGLSITRAIIEAQGGSLSLLDAKPSGLVARLTLGNDARELRPGLAST